ncbi:MAG: hypothetical protein U1F48_11730 [Burkholderiales bacterium]
MTTKPAAPSQDTPRNDIAQSPGHGANHTPPGTSQHQLGSGGTSHRTKASQQQQQGGGTTRRK